MTDGIGLQSLTPFILLWKNELALTLVTHPGELIWDWREPAALRCFFVSWDFLPFTYRISSLSRIELPIAQSCHGQKHAWPLLGQARLFLSREKQLHQDHLHSCSSWTFCALAGLVHCVCHPEEQGLFLGVHHPTRHGVSQMLISFKMIMPRRWAASCWWPGKRWARESSEEDP